MLRVDECYSFVHDGFLVADGCHFDGKIEVGNIYVTTLMKLNIVSSLGAKNMLKILKMGPFKMYVTRLEGGGGLAKMTTKCDIGGRESKPKMLLLQNFFKNGVLIE